MEKTELIHAGGGEVIFPEIRLSQHTKDFSWGFYCTNNHNQAKRWAKRKKPIPTINYYTYTENPSLKILKFEGMTDEWLDFIANCRAGNGHSYDIVEGPMADDRVWDFVKLYLSGRLSRLALLESAKFNYKTHQISFHTVEALRCLKFERSEPLK